MIQNKKFFIFNKQFSQVYQRLRFIFRINNINNKCKHSMRASEIKNGESSHVKKTEFFFGREKNSVFFPDFPALNPNSIKPAPSRSASILCSSDSEITVVLIKASFKTSVRRTSSHNNHGSSVAHAGPEDPQEPQWPRLFSFSTKSEAFLTASTQNFLGEHVEFEKNQAFFLRKLFSSSSFFSAEKKSFSPDFVPMLGSSSKSSAFSFCTSSIDSGEVKVFANSLQRWFDIKNKIVIGAGVKLIRYSFPLEKCIMKNHEPRYTLRNETKRGSEANPTWYGNYGRKKQNWDTVVSFYPRANFVGLLNQKNEKKVRFFNKAYRCRKGKCKCCQTTPPVRVNASTKVNLTACSEIKRQRYSLSKFQLVGYAVQAFLSCLDQTDQKCEFNFGSGKKNEVFSSARDLIRGVFIVWPFNCFAQKSFCPKKDEVYLTQCSLNNKSIGEEKVVFSGNLVTDQALKDNNCIHEYRIPRIIFISPNEFRQCIVSYKAGYGSQIESFPIILIRDLTHIKQRLMRIKNVMVYLYLITKLNHVTTF